MKTNERNSTANVKNENVKAEKTTLEKVQGQVKEKNLQDLIAKLQGTDCETKAGQKKGTGRRINSIYLDCVYQDENGNTIISKDEKKSIRRKIRKNLDSFLSDYFKHKSDKKYLEALSRDWVRKASKIYKDIFGDLYDGSDEEAIRQTKEFAKAMKENLTL